jgi:hypothetical protein
LFPAAAKSIHEVINSLSDFIDTKVNAQELIMEKIKSKLSKNPNRNRLVETVRTVDEGREFLMLLLAF